MTTITIEQVIQHNNDTKSKIRKLRKPLGAYQLYCQTMREQWGVLCDSEKNKYEKQAENENLLFEKKKKDILEKAKEKIRDKKIFRHYATGSTPCVGLDNGSTSYCIVGPVSELEIFTEAEKQKLKEKGVPEECIGKYKSVDGIKYNWRAAKKYNVTVYGGSIDSGWYSIIENYKGKAGHYTDYHNYKGERWTVEY